ncbi:MAG: phosphoribosylformylglycinamidine cyclo-ligase, partial [Candidatus Niyogibacteria bacterium]|nr:phosphoribosylformylglycinamidine cyclo-ligase [Candidatus Niyogibacteria bacterium]
QLKEFPDHYIAHVNEGLGTKDLIADDVEALTGRCYYGAIGQDVARSIFHDMITAGAHPFSVEMHLTVGSKWWFEDPRMVSKFTRGFAYACREAGCEWDGGETAILRDITVPGTADISGSAVGIVYPKKRVIEPRIESGDAIVMFAASGIHANSATFMRDIAKQLPRGYRTRVKNSKTFGELLLAPAPNYVAAIEACLDAEVEIHYAVHISGHGWRKLMRLDEPFEYIIETLPPALPLFEFLRTRELVREYDLYADTTAGAGFALYVPQSEIERVIAIAQSCGIYAWHAGFVRKSAEKRVVIPSKQIEFTKESLQIR